MLRDSWEAIADPAAVRGPVLVADWGGGWEGLDAAEVLAATGLEVTLACAAPCPGDGLHQYQRNLYLARLDELGVAIRHHEELAALDGDLVLRNVFSGRCSPFPVAATVVVAYGRTPDDGLWAALEGRPGRVRAGDVLGPRSLEEAVLEGVVAVRAARAEFLPAEGRPAPRAEAQAARGRRWSTASTISRMSSMLSVTTRRATSSGVDLALGRDGVPQPVDQAAQ